MERVPGLYGVFLGDGPQMPTGERVLHAGRVGHDEVARWLSASDFFVLPTLGEGSPNAVVEAMACGCPVIASTTGGAPEAVTDGESGFLVAPQDVEATAAAIDQVLGNESLGRRLGAAGRRRAENYFAREHYINRVLAAYQKTINRSQEKLASLKTRNG